MVHMSYVPVAQPGPRIRARRIAGVNPVARLPI